MAKYIFLSLIPGIGAIFLSIGTPKMLETLHFSPKVIFWIGIALICISPIIFFFMPKRKKDSSASVNRTFNNPDLFPNLNETLLEVWANKNANEHGGVKLIRLYGSPIASRKYYIYFKTKKFYRTKLHRDLFTNFLRSNAKKGFLYPLKEVYRSDLPLHWQDEWMIDTKLAYGIDKKFYWTLYKK